MKKRTNFRFFLSLAVAFSCLLVPLNVNSQEIQEVETDSSIQFTGIYEPIGTPEPAPPRPHPPGSVDRSPNGSMNRPGGSLPKTNMIHEYHLFWLGIGILFFVIFVWKRNKQQQIKNNQKVGIIL